MSVLINEQTRVIVQGLTGREGSFHAQQMVAYGTNVVAGVTPGKGGTLHNDVPVFDTVAEAVRETKANASIIFVPPPYAADAVLEAHRRGIAAGRLHHRRHPHAGHGARRGRLARQRDDADRPELSGHHLAGQMQDGHHAGTDSQGGQRRRG